jgi:hypothetical protein
MKWRTPCVALALVASSLAVVACEGEPDTRLSLHERDEVTAESTSDAALAWITGVAQAHREADAARNRAERLEILRDAVASPMPEELATPGGDGEVLALELATRLCETWLEDPADAPEAVAVLVPMLEPEASLPIDRASARALIVLGDAAAATGDLELAAGSYARALTLMSRLRERMEVEVGL